MDELSISFGYSIAVLLTQTYNPPYAFLRKQNRGFGLFPFRSPLLRESRLISFPLGTEMFHFSRLALYAYVFSA